MSTITVPFTPDELNRLYSLAAQGGVAPEDLARAACLQWMLLEEDRVADPLPEWHKEEIEKRLAHLKANPDDFEDWEDVRAELWSDL